MTATKAPEATMTRRTYLTIKACEDGGDLYTANDTVTAAAHAHPEWDMSEVRTHAAWNAR